KQELGLGHYKGRGWRGVHHHATRCIAAYGFLLAERSRFPPRPALDRSNLPYPKFHPTGSRAGGNSAMAPVDCLSTHPGSQSAGRAASVLPALLRPSSTTQ
ncbi:MAG: IS701 family transposase, partial [Alphaproteobacteria bacterium]